MSTEIALPLTVPARLSWEAWSDRMRNIGQMKRKLPFYIGDLLNYGEDAFGEKASQMINEIGYSCGALANLRYVSKRFPADERSVELPWSVYQAIAPFPKREREKLVSDALSGKITRAGIRLLAASRNGDREGQALEPENVPTGLENALRGIGEAVVGTGKLISRRLNGERCGGLLKAALDDLTAKSIALCAMLEGEE